MDNVFVYAFKNNLLLGRAQVYNKYKNICVCVFVCIVHSKGVCP